MFKYLRTDIFRLQGVVLLSVLAFTACGGDEPETPPYPVIDSGFYSSDRTDHTIVWLDNDRVLFVGSDQGKPMSVEDLPTEWGLYVFDIPSKSVTKYRSPTIEFVCLVDGILSFDLGKTVTDPDRVRMQGPMGEEVPTPLPKFDGPPWESPYFRDYLNCRKNKYADYRPEDSDLRPYALLDGDGYLLYSDEHQHSWTESAPITLHSPRLDEPKVLEFGTLEADPRSGHYYPFRDAYFFAPDFDRWDHQWKTNDCLLGWWMDRRGIVTSAECIPNGPWYNAGNTTINQTVKGPVITSRRLLGVGAGAGKAAVYLVEEGEAKLLMRGLAEARSVSPDGCRLAVSLQPTSAAGRLGLPGMTTLRIVDLCTAR